MFDKPYSEDKRAEGMAIAQSIITGECNKCSYMNECSSNPEFKFPENAACMKRKIRIERG